MLCVCRLLVLLLVSKVPFTCVCVRAGLCYDIIRVCVAAVFVLLLVLSSCFSMSRLLLSGVVVDAGLCRCCAVVCPLLLP